MLSSTCIVALIFPTYMGNDGQYVLIVKGNVANNCRNRISPTVFRGTCDSQQL